MPFSKNLHPKRPDKKPCFDNDTGEANPLLNMKISTDNKGWKSNTWGYVRYSGTKFHDGLDLLGQPGVTVVYSMYGGTVTRVVSGQPNKINNKDYPFDYSGDKNPAGNRITIETVLPDGKTIQVSYWYLDVKGKNPYTQRLKVGDTVNQGQAIGVVGNTGNAFGMLPHLHLKTHIKNTDNKNNSINNPYGYLYTKFDPNTNVINDDALIITLDANGVITRVRWYSPV